VGHLLGLDSESHIPLSQLADAMGVTRHQLMHLLDNDAPQINRRALGAAAEYLVGHGKLNPSDMFEQLFEIAPDAFWPLLAGRQRIDINLGVRWPDEPGWDQLVIAADAVLQSVLVNRLTGVAAESSDSLAALRRHAGQVINLELAVSWGPQHSSYPGVQSKARKDYRQLMRQRDNSAIVCLGSIKSNPMCELAIARGFRRAKPFTSEDQVASLSDRTCPFVMVYRKRDPHPQSCWGGERSSRSDRKPQPGIHFLCEPDRWDFAAWTELEDAALVYYRYVQSSQNLEMVLGGYSGRSTRCLAEMLRAGAAGQFWPPCVENGRISVGAFIVKFDFRPPRKSDGIDTTWHDRCQQHKVLPIPQECLAPRLSNPREGTSAK
jgi:hypothetical protein